MTVYDRGEFEKAHARLRSPPAELTMGDIEQLATFSPDLARQALAARKAALFPEPAPRTQAATHGLIATKNGLSAESIDSIAGSVVWFVKEQFQQQLAPLLRRLDALEQRPPSPHYQGVFQEEKAYGRLWSRRRAGCGWRSNTRRNARPIAPMETNRQER